MDDQEEKLPASAPKVEPIWGIAANIVKEHPYGEGGKVIKRGTEKFYGGAKVYIAYVFWGPGGYEVMVVGHYRGKHRYITSGVKTAHLENFHVELIYSPEVINRIQDCPNRWSYEGVIAIDGTEEAKKRATEVAESLAHIAQLDRDFRAKKAARQKQAEEENEIGDDSNHLF